MIQKIDINSDEFQATLEKTKKFTSDVVERFEYVFNPDDEINESVQLGLARNKTIYGKYYCPCFMVQGQTKEEQKEADNRICPCTPAREVEIPDTGKCHCGIFCTPEYVKEQAAIEEAEKVIHLHSRALSKEELVALTHKADIDNEELKALLEARSHGLVDFKLVDVREWMEWVQQRIQGTDFLVPTTSFYDAISQIEPFKEQPIILYCLTGSRSAYCQRMMKTMGYKHVANMTFGIVSYNGELASGEN
jgi:ferredoxin-thioredoxin reductase catalytic subunit/rhodanese-related sulfurtransferase